MRITDIRVFPVTEVKVKAYVTLTFEHVLVVRDVKVVQGKDGLFLAMPAARRKDGQFRDTVHPIADAFRSELTKQVLAAYYNKVQK